MVRVVVVVESLTGEVVVVAKESFAMVSSVVVQRVSLLLVNEPVHVDSLYSPCPALEIAQSFSEQSPRGILMKKGSKKSNTIGFRHLQLSHKRIRIIYPMKDNGKRMLSAEGSGADSHEQSDHRESQKRT